MKFLIYTALTIGVLFLSASATWRGKAITLASSIMASLTHVGDSVQSAEVREVSTSNFATTISEDGKLVALVIHKDLSEKSRGQFHEIKKSAEKLPANVILGSVSAEANPAIINGLKLKHLPAVCIYSHGRHISTIPLGEVKAAELTKVVQGYADKDASNQPGAGSIKPLPKEEPLPPGVQKARK